MALESILSQDMIQRLGWTLLHFVWQATAIALLLAILLATLRNVASNVRYSMACAALGLIVLSPIATMTLIPVSQPELIVDIEPHPEPAPVVVQMQPISRETLTTRVAHPEEPAQVENIEAATRIPWKQRVTEKLEASHPYLVMGWFIGVFGLSLWHLGGWAQLQRLKKRMVKQVDAPLQAKLNELAEKLRIHRAVRLFESALVQVPTVVGWLRPVILLPAIALTGLTPEQLEALLAHEMAHIRRCDYLINILQTIVETLGFYHPAVWWISHKIRIERENCCDDLAVGICGDRVCYARALTSMEEIRSGQNEFAVAATGGNLFGRIRRLIAKDASDNGRIGWIPSVISILLIAIIAIPASIALNANLKNKDQKANIAPTKVVLKLVDPNSQPIVGAQLGTSVGWSDSTRKPLTWFLREGGSTRATKVKSDKYGKITLEEADLFWSAPPTKQTAPIVAIDNGHSLASLQELSRENLGTEFALTLQPACRVHGRLTAATARKRRLSANNLNVWVYWRVHTPCQYTSKHGRFELVLPPGEYKLRFFSSNANNDFIVPIRIEPGQRDLDLTGYLDGTQKLPEIQTHRQDRKGSIDSNKIVIKLVDPNSQPVVGAWVGTIVDWSDIAESPPIWFLNDGGSYKASEIDSATKVISNEEGKITLTEEELFKPFWPSEVTVPVTAIDEGHYLAGLRELSREDLGTEVTLTLKPGCRVRGRATPAVAREQKWKSVKWLTVYVYWRVHRPCQYSSKEGQFEFILPPGTYEVRAYADDSDKDVVLPIRIKSGQRELDLTKYLDGTNSPPTFELSSNESNGTLKSLLERLADSEVNAEGQRILKRMAEVNRYWLIAPSPNVKSYSYDFNLYGRNSNEPKKETIQVKRPMKVNSTRRQGITYDSILHRLISDPSAVIIRKIRRHPQTIQLDCIFRDITEVEYGNGISHHWGGYFTDMVKICSLWLDANRMVPIKIKAGWPVEYFSEYVAVDENHYVPLKVTVGHDETRYHWTFGLYEPGLWLFENATYSEDENAQPRKKATIDHLTINKRDAVELKTRIIEVPRLDEDRKSNKPRKSVTVTLTEQGMSFEGNSVNRHQFFLQLADVPEPENTVLELVAASDKLSPEKLNAVKTRISLLSSECGFKYLGYMSVSTSPSKKSNREYFFTSLFKFNMNLGINRSAIGEFKQKYYRSEKRWGTDETQQHKEPATVYMNSIHFKKSLLKGNVSAKLKVAYDSWPKAAWRIVIHLLDDKGNRLARASQEFDTSGYILSGRVLRMNSELDFSLRRIADISKTAAFEITIKALPENKTDADIETMLLDGFRENRDKFKCGVLAWSHITTNDRYLAAGRNELKGSYQLWWDNKKIATKYADEQFSGDSTGRRWIQTQTGRNAYDGGFPSKKPKFRDYENWFEQIIRWSGSFSLDKEIAEMKRHKHVSSDWSIIDVEDQKHIKLTLKNLKDEAYSVRYFDLSKGCNQVRYEMYNAQKRLYYLATRTLQQDNGDGWFPVEVDWKFIDPDGKVEARHSFKMDLKRCSFNDPSAIPEGIFNGHTLNEQEQLDKILEKYAQGNDADEPDSDVKGPLESVKNYIATALADEDDKAAEYVDPRSAVAQQIDDTRETLQDQDIRIKSICIGEWNALAISSIIKADHGRTGPVVFHLKKVIKDQKIHWLIDDIDLETLDTIEQEMKRFLEIYSKAKTFIIKPSLSINTQTTRSENEPSNTEKSNPNTKILIETQAIHVTDEFLKQVGLDADSLKNPNSWEQYRVDNSSNLSSFIIDSQTKQKLLKNVAESEGSTSISRLFMMGMSGREAMIKNNSGYDFKSQKLGRSIKIRPELSQDGQSTYVDCELTIRHFKNLDLFFDVYVNKKIDQNDVSESEVVEHQRNTGKAMLSDDQTLLILGGKLVSFQDVKNGTPILRDIPVLGQLFNTTSRIKVEKNEIILIKTTITPSERNDDIDSKASSYSVATIGSKKSEFMRIYLDLDLEPGQYVEMNDSNPREPILKQVDTSQIGKSARDFPAYASTIDFEFRSNVDLNLSTQRFTRRISIEHDNWDAYFTGPETIIGNGRFSPITLRISAWKAKLWMDKPGDNIKPNLVAVKIKPSHKQKKSSTEVPTNALPAGWSLKYIEDSDVGSNRAILKAVPKPIDESDESWKQERLEFRISSLDGTLGETLLFTTRFQHSRANLKSDKYVLKYERRWGDSKDNFRIRREFPIDLSKPGIYELQFTPKLGTAKIVGSLDGCYSVNFEKIGEEPCVRGYAYQNAGKQYYLDGMPAGTYRLSAVTQDKTGNVFVRQAKATVSENDKVTVNITSPPRGACTLRGSLFGEQLKYQPPRRNSPGSRSRRFVLLRRVGSGPVKKTHAYEALTMDSFYVVRGSNIIQDTKDKSNYRIEGIVPGRYTITAIEHPWRSGYTITRQQSKTLTLNDGEEAVLDFDLRDIPKDDIPPAVETEKLIENSNTDPNQILIKIRTIALQKSNPPRQAQFEQQVTLQNGQNKRIILFPEEYFPLNNPIAENKLQASEQSNEFDSGAILSITPHIENERDVKLDVAAKLNYLVQSPGNSTLPVLRQCSADNACIVRHGGTIAAASLTDIPSAYPGEPERQLSVFVTVLPIDHSNTAAIGEDEPDVQITQVAGHSQDKQLMIDVQTVAMAPGDLAGLDIKWVSEPSPLNNGRITLVHGYSTGLPPSATIRKLCKQNRARILSRQQLLTLEGQPARFEAQTVENYLVTDRSRKRTKRVTIDTGTVLSLTPWIDDNNITVHIDHQFTDSIPQSRSRGLPVVTRRRSEHNITVPNAGTIVLSPQFEDSWKQKDKPGTFIFATVHLIPSDVPSTVEYPSTRILRQRQLTLDGQQAKSYSENQGLIESNKGIPEPQPESLLGKKIPHSEDMEILKQVGKKGLLICFWDMNQRPSRNMIMELAKRSKEIQTNRILLMLEQTSPVKPAKLKEWLDNREIRLPYYSSTQAMEAISNQELFRWGVRALPWLILADEEGIVQAEGSNIEQLDEILRERTSDAPTVNKIQPKNQITINGRCLDSNGDPLSDAQVMIFRRDYDQLSLLQITKSVTNSKGRFILESIALLNEKDQGHQNYLLFVPADDHGPAWKNIYKNEQIANSIELRTYNSATVTGRVVNEDSRPVSGAQVWVRGIVPPEATEDPASRVNDFNTFAPVPGWSATTQTDGSFRIDGVPDRARIGLFVLHRDFAGCSVHVKPGMDATIQMQTAAAITGRVLYGKTREPAVGVRVQAQGVENIRTQGGMTTPWANAVTDEQGRYRLESLYGAKYNIWAEAKNLTIVALDSFQAETGKTKEAPDMYLVEGGFITGRVIDEATGKPIKPGQGSYVYIHGPSRPRSGVEIESSLIHDDGTFRIRVAPGRNDIHLIPMEKWSMGKSVVTPSYHKVRMDNDTIDVEFNIRKLSKEEIEERAKHRPIKPIKFPIPETLDELGQPAYKMKQLGLALAMNHLYDDPLPDTLLDIEPFIKDEHDFQWIRDNVQYLGKGKWTNQENAAHIPIAYDRTMFDGGAETNVLFLDFSVRLLDRKKLNELGIYPQAIKRVLPPSNNKTKDRGISKVYDVSDLLEGCLKPSHIAPYITEHVEPESWYAHNKTAHGMITIHPGGPEANKITIVQTPENHEKIERILEDIRRSPEKLIKARTQILMEIKILTAGNAFMKHIGLDPNLIAESKSWSDYRVHTSDDSISFIIDPLHADLLIKTATAHQDAKIKVAPQFCSADGRQATIQIYDTHAHSFIPSDIESNNPSGKTGSKSDSIKLGTFIRLEPEALPDGNTVDLNFEWEHRQLMGFKKHIDSDQKTQKLPRIAVDKISTSCPIPDGKTLLITGKKITESKKMRGKIQLADFPLIGGLFHSSNQPVETRNLLILIKPTINPPRPRKAQGPPTFKTAPPFKPNDPLIEKLESKLKSPN